MSVRSSRSLSLAVALSLLPVLPLAAQGSFKSALPEDTLVFLTVPDIEASIAEMQDMPLMKMWREGEVQDFFADSLQMAKEHWKEWMAQAREMHEAGQLPFDPDELTKLRLQGLSFAVTSLAMVAGEHEPMPKFGLVAHMDFGESAPIWRSVVQTLLGMLAKKAGDEVEHTTREIAGATLHSYRPPAPEPGEHSAKWMPMGLHLAFVDDGLLVGTLDDDVTSILGAMQNGTARLTATKQYASAARALKTDGAEMEMYMRPGGFFDFLVDTIKLAKQEAPGFPEELDPEGIDRVIDAIGFRALRGIGSTCRYEGDRCISTTFVDSPEPLRKGFFAGATKELDLGFLQWVPKDAVSFQAFTFEPISVWNALESGLRAYDEDLAKMALGHVGEIEKQVGLSIRDDLLGSFGSEFIIWSMPMAAFGSTPEIALLAAVEDQEKLLKTLNTFAAMSNGVVEIDRVERRGITVYQVRLDIGDMGGGFGGMNPLDMFVPTFGFKDGYMVCGLSTSDVKRVFKRMEREDDPSGDIRSNPEFKGYLEKLPKQGLGSLAFTDWKAEFEGLYQLVTSMLVFVPLDDDIPFDLSLLPDSSTLTQHLSGSVTWSVTDANGYRSTTVSPFGPETVAVMCGLIGAGVAVFTAMSRGW